MTNISKDAAVTQAILMFQEVRKSGMLSIKDNERIADSLGQIGRDGNLSFSADDFRKVMFGSEQLSFDAVVSGLGLAPSTVLEDLRIQSRNKIYSTSDLIGFYGEIASEPSFIRDTFFPSQRLYETIDVDLRNTARRLLPLCTPAIEGSITPRANSPKIVPPFFKSKMVLDPSASLSRKPGEAKGPVTREMRVKHLLEQQERDLANSEEAMAVEVMLTGKLSWGSINSKEPTVVDFNRPAALTHKLAHKWGENDRELLSDLFAWRDLVQSAGGFVPDTVVMDPKALHLFLESGAAKAMMGAFRQTSESLPISAVPAHQGAQHVCNIGGMAIWVYQKLVVGADGSVQQMIPDHTVILGNREHCGGEMAYGAIQQRDNLIPASRLSTMWYERDPYVDVVMTASAPMPILGWASSTMAVTVA